MTLAPGARTSLELMASTNLLGVASMRLAQRILDRENPMPRLSTKNDDLKLDDKVKVTGISLHNGRTARVKSTSTSPFGRTWVHIQFIDGAHEEQTVRRSDLERVNP